MLLLFFFFYISIQKCSGYFTLTLSSSDFPDFCFQVCLGVAHAEICPENIKIDSLITIKFQKLGHVTSHKF